MLHQTLSLALALSFWLLLASTVHISEESFFFVQKHPQEHFCEADFVLVGKVLSKTTSSLSLENYHRVNELLELRPPPNETIVLSVYVKRVFKGHAFAKEGNTVVLVTSRIKTDLEVVKRRSYIFTGFVHLANVPNDYGHCSSLLETGRHVFVENHLNFMWGCSWFQHRSLLTIKQKQGLLGMYARSCDCKIVKCHGRRNDPRRYCFGDVKRALFGDGCVLHHENQFQVVRLMTCSRHCGGRDDACRWVTCPLTRNQRPQGQTPTDGSSIEPVSTTSSPNATVGNLS
ncbi:uncharacterized protein LOC110982155 [Acanthaster planci]|uniref:Uncharacterized protein LOC110982155 n=1 Tax=Acanthaster planci TaxID=133434 RepID=A0A8B7YS24_ACAPL|nr:uncharacterized protein LOC110982155 [Acanthaster planci]